MKRTALYLAVAALSTSPAVFADTDQATLNELKGQIAALTERLNQMEVKTETTATAVAKRPDSWADKIVWNGDFRYRYETIDNDQTEDDRRRNRVRARIGLTAQVSEDVKAGVGLASGGDDPVSTNQTLGSANTTKGINLDTAWIDWGFAENLHLVGGKTKNPYYKVGKNGMMWDGDYRPEGAHVAFDNGTIWAVAGYHFLESDNKGGKQDTEEMMGAQIGYKGQISDNAKFKVGGSYFYIPVEGSKNLGSILEDSDDPDDINGFGNSLVGSIYEFDYELVELFAEFNTKIADIPTTFFADYVKNTDADEDTGYATGVKFGKVKSKGDWEIGYTYQDLEADALFAAFTDSDFGGGGTDVKGHMFKAAYGISKNTALAVTYLSNEYDDYARDEKGDFDRLQIDLKTKF
ncbi:MAG: putative porin [Porticoccus sp.]|nr:putative porin [Porticoccus sp.]